MISRSRSMEEAGPSSSEFSCQEASGLLQSWAPGKPPSEPPLLISLRHRLPTSGGSALHLPGCPVLCDTCRMAGTVGMPVAAVLHRLCPGRAKPRLELVTCLHFQHQDDMRVMAAFLPCAGRAVPSIQLVTCFHFQHQHDMRSMAAGCWCFADSAMASLMWTYTPLPGEAKLAP